MSKINLTIQERLDQSAAPKFRKRSATVDGDSVTIGTPESADISLKTISGSVLVEIKFARDEWWLINLDRSNLVRINKAPIGLESKLNHGDEIEISGHKIKFETVDNKTREESPNFDRQFQTDEALWKFLIEDETYDEILINGREEIFVDFRGQLYKTPYSFSNNDFLKDRIRELTKQDSGWASTRLNRMLRIQAALPPIVEVPHLAIRKARRFVMTLSDLLDRGFGSIEQIAFLRQAIKDHQNILITGGTSTGKTVLLRSLVEQIDSSERVVVLEEEAETDWPHPHAVAIESGRGQLRTAVIECLRMRPTRLIVSEVRGAEAYEMMQAMNTGHSGSMTTMHANSPREALSRLESLILSAGVGVNLLAVRRQMAHAIHSIVHLRRENNGTRKIDQIVRIGGIQNDVILLSDPLATESQKIKQKIYKIDS